MAKLQIKIIEVDRNARIAVVKFATENSKYSIDDYDGVAFTLGIAQNVEQFIDSVKTQCLHYALERDYIESSVEPVADAETWAGFETEIDDDSIVMPNPTIPPEVEI